MIDDVEILDIKKVEKPKQTRVYELTFKEDGKVKKKEVIKTLDVAKILIYHKDKDAFVLVKQFRPLVYINHPDSAIRYELCGGRADKDMSIEDIAKEEVLEETGYKVQEIKKITTFTTSGKMHLFYTEVCNHDRQTAGGGVDYENIDVFYLPTKEAKEFMFDETKPKRPAMMFSLCWWFSMREQ
jgi:UDP-sugar diphosphatase